MSQLHVPDHVAPERVHLFDLYHDPRFENDLLPGFDRIVQETPDIFYTPLNGGHWVVTRYSLAEELLKDYEHFSAREMHIPRLEKILIFLPLHIDPPASLPYRHALMPYFAPKTIAALEIKIRQWAARFIDAVADKGQCDFLTDVAARFPVTIFMEMMGIPFDRFDSFRAMADEFFGDIPEARRHELMQLVSAEFMVLWEERKKERKNDLISVLVDADINGRPLSIEEMQSMTFLLFLAGLDTVVNVLTISYRALAGDKALQARLRREPSAIPGFVEECLRLFGVVNSPRIIAKDFERWGVKFRTGDMLVCLNPAFGRDERDNPNALTIDPDRTDRKFLTFSTGPHLCLGHNLARSELRIFTEEWLKRIPQFEVAPGFTPSFRPGLVMSMRSLPLQWPAQQRANSDDSPALRARAG